MIRHFDHVRFRRALVFSAVLVFGGVGCRHRQIQPVMLPAQTPVAIDVPPQPTNPPLVEAPKTKLPPVPVVRDEPNPKKVKKQRVKSVASNAMPPAPVSAGAPVPVPAGANAPAASSTAAQPEARAADQAAEAGASAAPAAGADVGVFTVGGDQSPRVKQDASNLIASNDRRLATAGEKGRTDPSLLSKVRNFQKEAQQALSSGDAEGARTLATKGKLLLDDMDRGVASQ